MSGGLGWSSHTVKQRYIILGISKTQTLKMQTAGLKTFKTTDLENVGLKSTDLENTDADLEIVVYILIVKLCPFILHGRKNLKELKSIIGYKRTKLLH